MGELFQKIQWGVEYGTTGRNQWGTGNSSEDGEDDDEDEDEDGGGGGYWQREIW